MKKIVLGLLAISAALGAFAQDTNNVNTNSVSGTNAVVSAGTNAPVSATNQYQVNLTLTGQQVAALAAMYNLPPANPTNINSVALGFINQAVAAQQRAAIAQQRLILANAIRNGDTNTLNRLLAALSATNSPSQ
jgi:hypothetical protein